MSMIEFTGERFPQNGDKVHPLDGPASLIPPGLEALDAAFRIQLDSTSAAYARPGPPLTRKQSANSSDVLTSATNNQLDNQLTSNWILARRLRTSV
jgi:hypothetical protein